MASESAERKKALRKSKKRARGEMEQQLERLESLPWSSSLPASNDGAGDDLSLFIGDNELEGGFLTLEEIDESEYGLELPSVKVETKRKKSKGKTDSKRSKLNEGSADESLDEGLYGDNKDDESKEVDVKKQKKKKKKKEVKKKKKENQKNDETNKAQENVETATARDEGAGGNIEEDLIDEDEYYAWNELRLHPMIMKSIYKLKFKEPTPIQKACIPAAAHQGKDVIGAAVTGSGKTLAFGLPILQRLLEEREKVERLIGEKGEANDGIAPRGCLRALIVTPTRELALQVTDHLKAVALSNNVRVVPIVGGMSTEKQERLLRGRPEIVVGTPGRLWELMSGGGQHLVEMHSLSFFVLDEADRMIEAGHFRELQSIIDMLPMGKESTESQPENTQNLPRKKRQTFVFSATLALSADFRKKLKHGHLHAKKDELSSFESLSQRAGMRANTAIVDLTSSSILANKLMESIIEYFGVDIEAIREYANSFDDIEHIRAEIRDFDAFDLRMRLPAVVSTLHKAIIRNGGVAYIHCTAGLGRAPGTAVAYMYWIQVYTLKGAHDLLMSKRPCFPKLESIKSATADILTGLVRKPVKLKWQGTGCSTVEISGLDIGWGQRTPLSYDQEQGVMKLCMQAGSFAGLRLKCEASDNIALFGSIVKVD